MIPAPALAPALPCVSLISCIVSFGSTATPTQMSKQRFITSVRRYIAHIHFYSYYTLTCLIPIVTCMHAGGRCHALMLQVSIHSACSVLPGTLVPSATKAMALTESFKKMKQPRCPAMSPMSAVLPPIMRMLITKVG